MIEVQQCVDSANMTKQWKYRAVQISSRGQGDIWERPHWFSHSYSIADHIFIFVSTRQMGW